MKRDPPPPPLLFPPAGPLIKAEVGEQVVITFKNMANRPYSITPYGVKASGAHVPVQPGEGTMFALHCFKDTSPSIFWPLSSISVCLCSLCVNSRRKTREEKQRQMSILHFSSSNHSGKVLGMLLSWCHKGHRYFQAVPAVSSELFAASFLSSSMQSVNFSRKLKLSILRGSWKQRVKHLFNPLLENTFVSFICICARLICLCPRLKGFEK